MVIIMVLVEQVERQIRMHAWQPVADMKSLPCSPSDFPSGLNRYNFIFNQGGYIKDSLLQSSVVNLNSKDILRSLFQLTIKSIE